MTATHAIASQIGQAPGQTMKDRRGDGLTAPRRAAVRVEQCLDALFAHLPADSAIWDKPGLHIRIAACIAELEDATGGMPLDEVARVAAYVLDESARHARAGS